MIGGGGGVQDIKARIGLEGAPQFAGQAKAAADSLGQISTQLGRVAASAEDIGRLGAGMAEMQADARASALALQQLVGRMGEVQAASERASRASNFMDRFGPGAVGVGGLLALKAAVVGVADEMVRVQVRAETLQSSLRFAIGADTAREMAYLRRVTHELGLEFTSSAKAYAGFAAAAKETKLEGAGARQVFESVASAAAVMGLSAENAQGVLLALQQMMSKGTVQAEELRGQLGERLPGAFQIAARAMGVTTGELGKMLEQGKVLSEDFLPKFAAQLRTELGDGAAASTNRTEAALNRLANAWERFKGADGGATAGFIAGQLNIATDALNDFSGSVEDARAKGDGFFGQFAAGLGAIARFANPFNALSYGAQDVGAKLRAAEDELARLQRKVQEEPGNIFTRMLIRDAEQLIERLRQAKEAKDSLGDLGAGGGRGFVNPQTVGAGLAERADLEAKLTEIRNKGLGVNKEWVASLQQLDAMQRTGLITDAERIGMAQALTAETYKSSRATSDAYGALARDIAKTIELNNARAQGAGAVTKGQELEIQLNNRLADSLKGLTSAQAARIRQMIAGAVASANAAEAAEREQRAAEQMARSRADDRRAEDRAIAEHIEQLERERRAVLRSVEDRVRSLQDEAEAVELTAGTNLTLAEGIEMVALARAREKQERYHEGSAPWEDVQREIEARQKLLGLMADKRVREAGIKAADETAAYWQRISDDAGKALADAIFDGGKSAGELLQDYFRTLVLRPAIEWAGQQGMAALLGLLGFGGGGGGGGAGGNAMQGINALSSTYNLYSGNGGMLGQMGRSALNYGVNTGWGSSLWYGSGAGLAQGGGAAANLGGMSAGAILGDGTYYGLSYGGGAAANVGGASAGAILGDASGVVAAGETGAATGSLGASSAGWGAAAGYAALAAIAVALSESWYEKGYTGSDRMGTDGFVGNAYALSGTDTGRRVLKGFGVNDKWSEILSGSVGLNWLFDQLGLIKTPHVGGYVSVNAADGAVTDLTAAQGGIQEASVQQLLTKFTGGVVDAFNAVTDTFKVGGIGSARSILESDNKDASWGIFQVQDKAGQRIGGFDALGTLPSNPGEAWQAFQGQTAEAMVQTLIGLDLPAWVDKQLGGFVASEAFTGLDTGDKKLTAVLAQLASIEQFQAALVQLGETVKPMGGAFAQIAALSSDATFALVEMAGGLEAFGQRTQSYLSNYYSDDERAAVIRDQLGQAIDDFNLALPTTREGFRALVEAQDLTTESGRNAFNALMGIEAAFAAITPAAQAAGEALRSVADIANERMGLQLQLWQVQGDQASIDAYNRAQIDPGNLDLYDAIKAAEAEAAAREAATRAEQERLAQLSAIYNAQQAAAAAAENAAYRAAQAWDEAGKGIVEEILRLRGEFSGPASQAGFAYAQSQFAIAAAQARAGDATAAGQLPGLSKAMVDLAERFLGSTAELELFQAKTAAKLEEVLRLRGISVPGFAGGGDFGGGIARVGEMGSELVLTGPSRILTAEQTRNALSGSDDMAAEMRGLRNEMAALHRTVVSHGARLAAIEGHADVTQRTLRQVTQGGTHVRTKEVVTP